jgi:CubicO group peptidase (beta-lactamase class C family)
VYVAAFVLAVLADIPEFPRTKVDSAMRATIASRRVNGLTLAVVRNGSIVYARAYGMRDAGAKLPATLETQYEIGSITKQMTAAAVMQLAEKGKIALDASLSTYLPNAPHAREVTIRELLALTAGLPEYLTGPELLADVARPTTPEALLARIQGKPLNFEPSTQWQHSNTNYLLLGMLIEKVSGKPYERVIFDDVLARAPGANFSVIDDEAGLSQMARGYVGDSLSPPLSGSWPWAAGNLVGSVGDLLAWDAALSSGRVVSMASYATMTSQQAPASSATVAGFPFFIDTHRGYARLWHDGSTIGFSVADDYYPQLKIRVIVFANANNGGIADELATVTFDDWLSAAATSMLPLDRPRKP